MATVYKKTSYKEINNRTIEKTDVNTSNSINQTISNFVNYFKLRHLS